MQRISMAQKRINRVVDQIKADFNAGASLKFLARKYEVSAEVIRRNLIEWNLMSSERDASKVHNTSPTFGREQKDEK
jgi:Zn-dependent peptidase ImmA (M78 family)